MKGFGDVRFSRTGNTSPFGKLDEPVSFRESAEVVEAFQRKAAAMGMPASELARIAYRIVALGPDTVRKLHTAPIDEVARMLAGMSDTSG